MSSNDADAPTRRTVLRAAWRDGFLVVSILTLMLGLVAPSLGPVAPESLSRETPARSSTPGRAVLLGTALAPLAVGDRFASDPASYSRHPPTSQASRVIFTSSDDDPRAYLSQMAALQHLRGESAATALDPYQARKLAAYLAIHAPPIDLVASPTIVPERTVERQDRQLAFSIQGPGVGERISLELTGKSSTAKRQVCSATCSLLPDAPVSHRESFTQRLARTG